jgi:hypothetical protein
MAVSDPDVILKPRDLMMGSAGDWASQTVRILGCAHRATNRVERRIESWDTFPVPNSSATARRPSESRRSSSIRLP